MTTVTIRRATASDAAALAELGRRTFVETFAAHNTPEDLAAYVGKTYGEEQQRRELADTLVAEEDGALVAFALLRRKGSEIEIARFYVAQSHHGRGIAQQLMSAVEAEAAAKGATRLWLGVWEHNPRAIAFYKKCGFRETGSQPFLLGSDLQTDLVLEKEV